MTRTISPRFFLTAALSTSLFAAACGGDDHATAKFTGADDAHLDRALTAIAGGDLGSVYIVGAFVAGTNQPGCPSFAYANNVTTVTGGGCVNEDGVKLEGPVTARDGSVIRLGGTVLVVESVELQKGAKLLPASAELWGDSLLLQQLRGELATVAPSTVPMNGSRTSAPRK